MRTNDSSKTKTLGIAALALLGLGGCPGDDAPADTDTDTDTDTDGTSTTMTVSTTMVMTTEVDSSGTSGSTTTDPTEGSSSTGPGEEPLLERVLEGLGGRENVEALVDAQIDASGERSMADEGFDPGEPAMLVSSFTTTTSVEFDTFHVRNEITRDTLFVPVPMPLQITEIANGAAGGYVLGVESLFGVPPEADMLSDRFASTIKQAVLLNPHFFIKAAALGIVETDEIGTGDFEGETYDLLEIEDDVAPVVLWVTQDDNVVRRMTSMENSHLHRDVVIEGRYDGWENTGADVMFPTSVQIYVNDDLTHEESRSQIETNLRLDPSTWELPAQANPMFDQTEFNRGLLNHHHNQTFVSLAIPLDGLQPFIMADEIAPGVHHITGGSHNSMIIEQDGGLVVFDAPLNQQRCEAILTWIDDNLAGAPVTHIVQSHHHIDHSSCTRTFVATGATLVVHESAESFFQDILAAPSTVEPDRLETDPPMMAPTIEVVPAGDSFLIPDGTNPVEVFELLTTHSADMVLPFVTSSGVAFTVDIYNPGQGALLPTGPQEVLDSFMANGIYGSVQLVAGGHGGFGTLGELEMVAMGG